MITCKLGEKTYHVDFITGRALREIGPALEMYAKINRVTGAALKGEDVDDTTEISEALDVMVQWFCLLFKNQFTPEEVYDGYPVDRLMHDMVLALLAVESQTSSVLEDFPTTAAQETKKMKSEKS